MTDPNLAQRRGRISVHRQMLLSLPKQDLSTLFKHFFPVQIEEKGGFLYYYGYSSKFDKIEDWSDIPEYSVCVFDDGSVLMERITNHIIPEE